MKWLFIHLIFLIIIFFAGCKSSINESDKIIDPKLIQPELVGFENILITSLSINSEDPQNLFVSTQSPPAIYRSMDFGKTWTKVQEGFISYSLLATSNIVYAGRTRINDYQPKRPFLLKSTDYGLNWFAADSGILTFQESVIKVLSLNNDNVVFVLLRDYTPMNPDGNLYYSEDGGKSFKHSSSNPQFAAFNEQFTFDVCSDPAIPGKVLVTIMSQYRIAISKDYGNNWIGKEVLNNFTLDIVEIDSYNNIVVGIVQGFFGSELQRKLILSTDGGDTFSLLSDSLLTSLVATNLIITPELNIIICGYKNDKSQSYLYISKDIGESWQQLTNDTDSKSLLAYDHRNKFLYFVKDKVNKGLYRVKL